MNLVKSEWFHESELSRVKFYRLRESLLQGIEVCKPGSKESSFAIQSLWKNSFYRILAHYRQKMEKSVEDRQFGKPYYIGFLLESIGFYRSLIDAQLACQEGKEKDGGRDRGSDDLGKIYICYGDLYRYVFAANCDPCDRAMARKSYLIASELNPNDGHAFNQLSLLCLTQEEFLSYYYYCRGAFALQPSPSSLSNLKSIGAKYVKLNQSMLKSLSSKFVFLQSCLMQNLEVPEFVKGSFLTAFESYLLSRSFDQELLFQLVIISICVYEASGSNRAASSLYLEIINIFLTVSLQFMRSASRAGEEGICHAKRLLGCIYVSLIWCKERGNFEEDESFILATTLAEFLNSVQKLSNVRTPSSFTASQHRISEDVLLEGFRPLNEYVSTISNLDLKSDFGLALELEIRIRKIIYLSASISRRMILPLKYIAKTDHYDFLTVSDSQQDGNGKQPETPQQDEDDDIVFLTKGMLK